MISRARSSLFGALTALLLPAGLAVAKEPGPIVGIQIENDFFVSNDDGEYTHGMQLSYLSGANDVPDLVVDGANWLPMFDVGDDNVRCRRRQAMGHHHRAEHVHAERHPQPQPSG